MKISLILIFFILIPNIARTYSWLGYMEGDILRLNKIYETQEFLNYERKVSLKSGVISLYEKVGSTTNERTFLYYPSFSLTFPFFSKFGIKLEGEPTVDFQYKNEASFFDTLNPDIKAGELTIQRDGILYSVTSILWVKPVSWISIYAGYDFLKGWKNSSRREYYYSGVVKGENSPLSNLSANGFLTGISGDMFSIEHRTSYLDYPSIINLSLRYESIIATIICTQGSNLPTVWHLKFEVSHPLDNFKLKYGGSISPWWKSNEWDKVTLSCGINYKILELNIAFGSRSYTKVPAFGISEEEINEFTVNSIIGLNYKF